MSNFMVPSGAKFCLTPSVKQVPFHPCVNLYMCSDPINFTLALLLHFSAPENECNECGHVMKQMSDSSYNF